MRNDDAQRQIGESREEQRDLVYVFDHDFGLFGPERPTYRPPALQREAIAVAGALYLDAIQHRVRRTTPPARGDQPDPVSPCCKATKDLEQMDLGASRM